MKILDIAIKDLIRSARSLFLIGMAIGAPLLLTALIYFAFGSISSGTMSMASTKVGMVNADVLPANSPLEAPLGDSIRSVFFDNSVKSQITASDYADEAAARAAVDAQEIGVAIIIPATFTADYYAGKKDTTITILQDPTLAIGPTMVRDMVTASLDGFVGGGIAYNIVNERMTANDKTFGTESIPSLRERYANWYADFQRAMFHTPEKAALIVKAPAVNGDMIDSVRTMMGLVMSGQLIFFSFYTGAYAMMSILQEAEEGTLERLFTTPTDRTTILAGKFLAVFITVIIQGGVLLIAGHYLFKINWGEPGSLTLSLLGQMFASVGLAVLLVSFIKTTKQAGPIFGGGLTMLGMISGLFTANMKIDIFNTMGNFTPQGWVLKAWKLSIEGQPVSELIVPFIVMFAMGVAMFAIGARMFGKRFA